MDLAFAPAHEIAAAVRRHDLSPVEVMEAYPFNLTGHPACTVRAGFSDDGLPIGFQMVAERGREDLLLKVARAWERVRPFDGWPVEPRPGS